MLHLVLGDFFYSVTVTVFLIDADLLRVQDSCQWNVSSSGFS
jgi:hypothetical protein